MKKSTFMLALLCAALGTTTATAMPDTKEDLKAGDDTNAATFSWSDKTLTITGKGDLSKVNVTDNDIFIFSAEGAGMIYRFSEGGTSGTWVKVNQGDSYDSEAQYCEAKVTYSNEMTPLTSWNQNYSMTSAFALTLSENQSIHAIYWVDNGATAYVTVAASNEQSVQNSNNWDNKDSSTGYYFWCIFTGSYSGTEYSLTLKMSDFGTNGVYQGDGYTITLLNDNNRDTYGGIKSTIKASVDNLYYSTDATTYTWLPKDKTVEYTDGMKLYLGENTASEEHIRDNDTYFAKHHNYLEAATMSFADYLPYAVEALGCSADHDATVVIKTERGASEIITDNSKLANINNTITRALVAIDDIETLNLQDTYLEKIGVYDPTAYGTGYGDPTLFCGTPTGNYDPATNKYLKTLYMPATKEGTEIAEQRTSDGNNVFRPFQYMEGLKNLYLSEGITTLGANAISNVSKNNIPYLTSIVFPNTLKTTKSYCLGGQKGILTLTFPKGMESIERQSMWGTNPKDVYFLDVNAPKVAAFAWGESNYISNNAMTNEVKVGDTEETSIEVDKQTGVAVRQNYETQNGWMAMLHYPAACTKSQAARYTDLTRDYKKIVYGVENETFKVKKSDVSDGTAGILYYYYEAGKETEGLTGKPTEAGDADITASKTADTFFQNRYPTTSNPLYGGDYTGGYEDYYVGSQYIWPSMSQLMRAIIVAENNVLWDGVTSIAEGIKNNLAGTESYDGDGSEYIGLHQFVFTQADVTTDKTDEWDVTKYADGKWHSICLPFNVTKAKMKETFGANAAGEYNFRVCKFHKVDRTDEKLKLYFNDEYFEKANDEEVVLTAHVSYMIKAKKENMVEGEKVVLKNYVLEAGSPVPTNVTVNAKSSGSEGETEANQYYFIGQYNSGVTIPQYSYFFSKSKGYFRFQAGTTAKWNGYTSVVEAPNGAEDYQKYFNGTTDTDAKLSTIWDEDETTGIEKITIVAGDEVVYTNDNVYNLNGQLVSTQGKSGLAKGIYIQNGKKFVVK